MAGHVCLLHENFYFLQTEEPRGTKARVTINQVPIFPECDQRRNGRSGTKGVHEPISAPTMYWVCIMLDHHRLVCSEFCNSKPALRPWPLELRRRDIGCLQPQDSVDKLGRTRGPQPVDFCHRPIMSSPASAREP